MPAPVYLTINEFPGTGAAAPTTVDFNFAGGYISRAHVKAEVFNPTTLERTPIALVDGDFLAEWRVAVPASVPTGSVLRVYRATPKDAPLVDFSTGARLTEPNLDLTARQAVFVAAESTDQMAALGVVQAIEAAEAAQAAAAQASISQATATAAENAAEAAQAAAEAAAAAATGVSTSVVLRDGSRHFTGNVDAGWNRVVSLLAGTAGDHAVNRAQLDALATATLPSLASPTAGTDVSTLGRGHYVIRECTGLPAGADVYGQLLVLEHPSQNTVAHLYIPYNTGVIYTRGGFSGGALSPWVKAPAQAQVDAVQAQVNGVEPYVHVLDTRADNQPPSWYWANHPSRRVHEFKERTAMGAPNYPGTFAFGSLSTDVQWDSTAGGQITQVFRIYGGLGTERLREYTRFSVGTSSWSPWVLRPCTGVFVGDLNTLGDNGTYYVGEGATGYPGESLYGQLHVCANNDTVTQVHYGFHGNISDRDSLWFRNGQGYAPSITWRPWQRLTAPSAFGRTLSESADIAAARVVLGAGAVGSNVLNATTQEAARSAIGVSAGGTPTDWNSYASRQIATANGGSVALNTAVIEPVPLGFTELRGGEFSVEASGFNVVYPTATTINVRATILVRNLGSVARTFQVALMYNGSVLSSTYSPQVPVPAGGVAMIPVNFDSVTPTGGPTMIGFGAQCTTTPAAGTCTATLMSKAVFTMRTYAE